MSQEKDKLFFRNFSLIVGALAVLMVVFFVTAKIAGSGNSAELEQRKSAAVAETTAPMGEVAVTSQEAAASDETGPVEEVAAAEGTGDVGKKIYDGLCVSCHGSGIPGIPQMGDKAAWEPRIAQGKDTLYQHAIQGYTGASGMMMPPKGGGANSDDEVEAAVDYIVAAVQSGTAATVAASPDATAAGTPTGADGKKVYDGLCVSCHGTGLPGIPQFGDKAAWELRIAKGMDALYTNAITGFTGASGMMMPPKGGGANTDDEVKAAVDYIVSNSK